MTKPRTRGAVDAHFKRKFSDRRKHDYEIVFGDFFKSKNKRRSWVWKCVGLQQKDHLLRKRVNFPTITKIRQVFFVIHVIKRRFANATCIRRWLAFGDWCQNNYRGCDGDWKRQKPKKLSSSIGYEYPYIFFGWLPAFLVSENYCTSCFRLNNGSKTIMNSIIHNTVSFDPRYRVLNLKRTQPEFQTLAVFIAFSLVASKKRDCFDTRFMCLWWRILIYF
jgi:hypothetical protein